MSIQSIDPLAQAPAHRDELQQQTWFTTKEAAAYVRRSVPAFYMWLRKFGVSTQSRYHRKTLDALIERENQLRKRRRNLRPVTHRKASA